jgi:hypothetical protein
MNTLFFKKSVNKNRITLGQRPMPSSSAGQAALEFALIAPVLILGLFAVITLGFWLYAKTIVVQAAFSASRELSLTNDTERARAAAGQLLEVLPKGAEAHLVLSASNPSDSARRRGGYVTVSIEYVSPMVWLPFLSGSNANSTRMFFKEVTGTTVVRMECDPASLNMSGYICPPIR